MRPPAYTEKCEGAIGVGSDYACAMIKNPYKSPAPVAGAPETPSRYRAVGSPFRRLVSVMFLVIDLLIGLVFVLEIDYIDKHPDMPIDGWILAEVLLLFFAIAFFALAGYWLGRPWHSD